MSWKPDPILDDKERAMLTEAPETCLRSVLERGALSIHQITAGLSPRLAAVLQYVATGERSADLPDQEAELELPDGRPPQREPRKREPSAKVDHEQRGWVHRREGTRWSLGAHPLLLGLLDEETLTPNEVMDAAHAIDRLLGRYMTGTRYAVP